MTSTNKSAVILVALLAAALQPVAAEEAETSIDSAIANGDASLQLRYRYEFVDDADFDEDAHASTLRIRLNYETGKWQNWSAFGEVDYVGEVLINDFNSGGGTSSPRRNQYPVVADPKGADLNQLYADFTGFDSTRIRLGRQRIILDNQRFVGGVGWRQQEQTYDALSLVNNSVQYTQLTYAYVLQVNRIFGPRSSAGRNDVDTHLLNANIAFDENWAITPYFYLIDNDDVAAFSTRTFGARLVGTMPVQSQSLNILAEFATQSDNANNPVNYDADYLHLVANLDLQSSLSVGLGFESLGGESGTPGASFRTPLATLHAFQGWADQLLVTTAAGVDDLYVSASYNWKKWSLKLVFHDFQANDGPGDWGSEFDFSASRALGDRYRLLLKAAFFDADDVAFSDATKLWIQFSANY